MRPATGSQTSPRIGLAVPVGAYDPRLSDALRSIAAVEPVDVALLDASGDPRVAETADASGIAFAYRRHGPDDGQAAAIQEGWDYLRDADVLGWLNADDLLLPAGVAEAREAFIADPDLDVHYNASIILDSSGATVGAHPQVDGDPASLLKGCTISQPSCFVRRDAIEAVHGLDTSLHFTMDWDLWARLYLAGRRFTMGREFGSAVYWGRGTKTSQFGPRRLAEIARLTARLTGPVQAAKGLIGMTIHHASNALAPHSPARLAIRPDAPLRLPAPNVGDQPGVALDLAFNGDADAVTANAINADISPRENGLRLTFHSPVPPGETVFVDLACRRPARLLCARWAVADPLTPA